MSAVRLTPTIQTLERKLQVLKRAIKVKHDGDENTLRGLVGKWRNAGREVAWELWELTKDNTSSDGGWGSDKQNHGEKRPFQESWGWSGQNGEKKVREEERNWGWNVSNASEEGKNNYEEDRSKSDMGASDDERDNGRSDGTLGTMLFQLGIAPQTLRWNEEEGGFED